MHEEKRILIAEASEAKIKANKVERGLREHIQNCETRIAELEKKNNG